MTISINSRAAPRPTNPCRLLGAVLAGAPALAQAAEPLGAGQALQVVVGLAVVLALILITAWASRRLHLFKPQGRGRIKVLETLPLGARERLLLVEVDDTRVLLGTCPGRIATLHAFSAGQRPDFAAALQAAADSGAVT